MSKKSAAVVTFEHEALFWEKKILSNNHPKSLQRDVFYSVGLRFALRGVQEQHDLKLEQLKRYPPEKEEYSEEVYYEYSNSSQRTTSINLKTLTLLTKP